MDMSLGIPALVIIAFFLIGGLIGLGLLVKFIFFDKEK